MRFSDFDDRRIELYLGGLLSSDLQEQQAPIPSAAPIICRPLEVQETLEARVSDVYPGGLGELYRCYIKQAQAFFARFAPQSCFTIYADDSRVRFASPVIVKSRLVRDRDAKGVLLPINRYRHWGDIPMLKSWDRPFNEKDSRLIWRGGTTGVFSKKKTRSDARQNEEVYYDDSEKYSARYYVSTLEKLTRGIDVKYSELVQVGDGCDLPLEILERKLGNPLTIKEQLASKFLLCLEGNDVASGLKWMMASNSTVIMPKATCETWFCEGELQPWVHYVPVAADLSDINEVYEWCLSNVPSAEQIAQNGKSFVRNFVDRRKEMKIIKTVVSTYAKQTDFKFDVPSTSSFREALNCIRLLNVARRFGRSIDACRDGIEAP